MKNSVFFIYLLILAGSTYLIRVIPFIAIKEKINNSFVRSFLYYIPYAVLTAMTIMLLTGGLVQQQDLSRQ